MDTKPIMETVLDADVVADVDSVTVGEPDAHDHQLQPLQNTAGPTETAHMEAKDVHTLLTDTRSMQHLRK